MNENRIKNDKDSIRDGGKPLSFVFAFKREAFAHHPAKDITGWSVFYGALREAPPTEQTLLRKVCSVGCFLFGASRMGNEGLRWAAAQTCPRDIVP